MQSMIRKLSRLNSIKISKFYTTNSGQDGTNMSEKLFWDKFYKKNNKTPFEWIVDTSSIDEILSQIHNFEKNVSCFQTYLLDAGCGSSLYSSRLSESLPNKNYLICADFSRDALELIKFNHVESKMQLNVDFVQCNCKRLPIRDNVFDLILDKGYLDSLLKKMFISTNQNAMDESLSAMNNLLEKLEHVNKSENENTRKYLIQITDETPELRISLFDQIDQSLFRIEYFFKEICVGEQAVYYAYFIRKF